MKTKSKVWGGIVIAVAVIAWVGFKREIQKTTPPRAQVTLEQIEKMFAERFPSPTPQPSASLIPAILPNPWETDEDRELKKRKYGFTLVEADGREYLRIHRKDDDEVGKGITSRDFIMESTTQPQVTNVGGKWETVFENEVPTPVPSPK